MDREKTKKDRALAQVEMAKVCPDALIGLKAVGLLTGWARASVYRHVAAGNLPRPVGPGRWRGGDVLDFCARKGRSS